MPRKDRTFSAGDVLRIIRRHLSEGERLAVIEALEVGGGFDEGFLPLVGHLEISHHADVESALTILGEVDEVLRNVFEQIGQLVTVNDDGTPHQAIRDVNRELRAAIGAIQNVLRQVPRVAFLLGGVPRILITLTLLLDGLTVLVEGVFRSRDVIDRIEEIQPGLLHLLQDMSALRELRN